MGWQTLESGKRAGVCAQNVRGPAWAPPDLVRPPPRWGPSALTARWVRGGAGPHRAAARQVLGRCLYDKKSTASDDTRQARCKRISEHVVQEFFGRIKRTTVLSRPFHVASCMHCFAAAHALLHFGSLHSLRCTPREATAGAVPIGFLHCKTLTELSQFVSSHQGLGVCADGRLLAAACGQQASPPQRSSCDTATRC